MSALFRAHITDIEEKLGGSVKVTCAAYNRDLIEHGTILEAADVPRGRTKDVPGSDTSKPDEIPDFRTAAPGSKGGAAPACVHGNRDDASLLKVEAILNVAELLEILEDNPKGRALVEKLERLLEAKNSRRQRRPQMKNESGHHDPQLRSSLYCILSRSAIPPPSGPDLQLA